MLHRHMRYVATAVLIATAGMSGGCSSIGGMFGSSSADPLDGVSPKAAAAQPATGGASPVAVAAAQTDFECPGVDIRTGASTLAISAPGRPSSTEAVDPSALELRYQGSIVRTARECSQRAGVVSIKVGVEGRIVVGPAGGAGQLDVPIRYAVVKEGTEPKTIVTRLHRVPVTVAADAGRVSFSHVADDLSFPMPAVAGEIDSYVVYVGFDPQAEAKPRPAPRRAAPRRQG